MADPKYANLPGIAYDQPDVYETEDLPEADQDYEFGEDQSEAVERLHISAPEAHAKFKDKWLDSSSADFSGRLTKRRQTGYAAWHGDLELAAEGEKETPLQKFHRLQCELNELQEDLAESKGQEGQQPKLDLAQLFGQLESMQNQIVNLKLKESIGTVLDLSDPQGLDQKNLLAQVEHATSGNTMETGQGQVMYQLQFKPEQIKLDDTLRAAALEAKIQKLETMIGATPEKMSSLAADTNQRTISGALQLLQSKVALLDPPHLEQIEGRLTAVLSKMDKITEKKINMEDTEKLNKVSEVYEMLKKTEPKWAVLPSVVERLVALQDLHGEAAKFAQTFKQLEVVQHQLESSLGSNALILKDVKEGMASNMETMKKNMSAIEARIDALSSKRK